ncbi:hypothetical protein [Amycolatopsis pithecellobii]|uniref:Uncharacterized protein n=1 Tax=Amycolatopsis pithecellobii TaxID=664692 RepID=A0A6N7YW65_9PSEU|nr:hypothetical protein [Amycolatopsis pithecellobii]MTD57305.1 hypothetical protein [Amycolatopsis pithecellobii]
MNLRKVAGGRAAAGATVADDLSLGTIGLGVLLRDVVLTLAIAIVERRWQSPTRRHTEDDAMVMAD